MSFIRTLSACRKQSMRLIFPFWSGFDKTHIDWRFPVILSTKSSLHSCVMSFRSLPNNREAHFCFTSAFSFCIQWKVHSIRSKVRKRTRMIRILWWFVIIVLLMKKKKNKKNRKEKKRNLPEVHLYNFSLPRATSVFHVSCKISVWPLEDWTMCMRMIWRTAIVLRWMGETRPIAFSPRTANRFCDKPKSFAGPRSIQDRDDFGSKAKISILEIRMIFCLQNMWFFV